MWALGLGQPWRGLTSRSRERPKFAMARAAAPIFSPSCGSTRTTVGPGRSIQFFVLSVPAPGIIVLSLKGMLGRLEPNASHFITTLRGLISANLRLASAATGAIGRALNSRQPDPRSAVSAPRTIHLRTGGEAFPAPVDGRFPVGPNTHGDWRGVDLKFLLCCRKLVEELQIQKPR